MAPKAKQEERFALGKAPHVGVIRPEDGFENVDLPISELIKVLTSHRIRDKKDGVYITRPMVKGDKSRSDANAGPWRLVPVDIDELEADELPMIRQWFERQAKLRGFISTTFSHKPERPKVRLLLIASRDVEASEHAYVHRALESMVPFKIDPCMAKPSQPIFLPSCPADKKSEAFAQYIDGTELDIDKLLDAYKKEMEEEQRARAERAEDAHKTGVRQPGGVIEWFNANFDLAGLLVQHGYKRRSMNRFVAPGSTSKRAAVVLYEGNTLVSFHDPAHDPLAVQNKMHQQMVLDAFAVYCKLQHADNFKKAFEGALQVARSAGWEGESAIPESDRAAVAAASGPTLLLDAVEVLDSLAPQDMLIEDILDTSTVTVVSGDSNSGKTTVLQYLALQVATGTPFANKKTKQGTVLWIAGEDINNAKYRLAAMYEEYGLDPELFRGSLLVLPQPIRILDADNMLAVYELIRSRIGQSDELALIVVDSKSVNWGGSDENSNDENAQFVAAVRKFLISPFGHPAVLITHHLTKQREKETRTSRGGGALINNADHEWRFEMNQDARVSAMMPGSKVRMERWPEIRFQIKTVALPEAKYPQLVNNFGEMPKVSVADPVNQYARSMKQIQMDQEMRTVLSKLAALRSANSPAGTTDVARELGWVDGANDPDYRKVKRVLEQCVKQKLAVKKGKDYRLSDGGKRFIEDEAFSPEPVAEAASTSASAPVEREPGQD